MSKDWLVLIFAMACPTALAWLYFVVLAQPLPEERVARASGLPQTGSLYYPERAANRPVQLAWAAGKTAQFSFPLLWVLLVDKRRPQPARPSRQGLLLGLAFGLLVGVAILLVYQVAFRESSVFSGLAKTVRGKITDFGLGTPAKYVFFGIFLAGIHSLLEEYYYRWFIFGKLRNHLSLWQAIGIGSLAFMAHHVIVIGAYFQGPGPFWTLVMPFSLCVAAGGAVWAWLYERTGAIYASWLSHLLIDAAIMIVGYDLVFAQ